MSLLESNAILGGVTNFIRETMAQDRIYNKFVKVSQWEHVVAFGD